MYLKVEASVGPSNLANCTKPRIIAEWSSPVIIRGGARESMAGVHSSRTRCPNNQKISFGVAHNGENRLFYLEIFFDPGSCATGKLHLDPPLPLTMLYLQNTLY